MVNSIPNPSDLSRNYSGSSAIYTPEPIVDYIISGLDTFLKEKFDKTNGILEYEINFFEPAVGLLAFPLGLFRFAEKNRSRKQLNEWISTSFLKHFLACEMDPLTNISAIQLFQEKIEQYNCLELKDTPNQLSIIFQNTNALCDPNPIKPHNRELLPRKKDQILIIFGNPPYAVSSYTRTDWIRQLITTYKEDIDRQDKKRITGLKSIQDEYIKFLRLGQWMLDDRQNFGIMAYIINNYFLDGEIFRGVRSSILKAFDEIWILNLHGDPKKKRKNSSKIKDENIFDIQTGVCIIFCLKYGQKIKQNPYAQIYYDEIIGSKSDKISFLLQLFNDKEFVKVHEQDDFEFIPLDPQLKTVYREYMKFHSLTDIFQYNIVGVQSLHDTLVTHPDRTKLEEILKKFYNNGYKEFEILDSKNQKWIKTESVVYHDARDWSIEYGMQGSLEGAISSILEWQWRGFDKWPVAYNKYLITKGVSGFRLMQFLFPGQNNLALGSAKISRKAPGDSSVFIINTIAESHFIEGGSGIGDYIFPLRINLSMKKGGSWTMPLPAIDSNFSPTFLQALSVYYNLPSNHFNHETLFYYIYAILWTPCFRKNYQAFLRQGFPRIPIPKEYRGIDTIAEIGKRIAEYHLLTSAELNTKKWHIANNHNYLIESPWYSQDDQRIYFQKKESCLNKDLFWIGEITPEMWDFEIGGIPQLANWLNNRKYSTKEHKFGFTRPINASELHWFLKICSAIALTLKNLPILDTLYLKFI